MKMTHGFCAAALLLLLLPGLHPALAGPVSAPLVNSDELKAMACDPDVVVLDIRSDKIDGQSRAGYEQEHVPCAVHSDYVKDGWRAKVDGVPAMLPPMEKLEALIGGLGIDDSVQVVIAPLGADAKSMAAGARVYWTLKVLGHDRVSILDGGTLGYAGDEARPLEQGARSPVPRDFKARLRPQMLVSADEVADAARQGQVLVDYRAQDEFTGLNRNEKTTRPGTLAGAVNLPLAWLTRDNGGHIRSPEAMTQLYRFAGIPPDAGQIAFCNTGHNSSLGWFVAHELMGNDGVRLYDGSMAQWSREDARPLVQVIDLAD